MRRSLTLFNWNAGVRLWYDSILNITGFVFVGYALALGVQKEQIGLLASVSSLACVVQLLGLVVMNAITDKKRFAVLIAYIEPVVIAGMIVAVYVVPLQFKLPVIAVGVLIAASSIHFIKPTIDEWLASSIPENIRGRYLGRRMVIVSVISIVATQAIGFVTKYVDGFGAFGYGVLLLAGTVFGIVAVQTFWGISMPAISAQAKIGWSSVPEVLREKPFIRYVAAVLLYNVPFWLAAPYYQVFHLKVLGLDTVAIAAMMTGYFVIKILLLPFFGRLVDRIGGRALIYLATPLYVLLFLFYAVSGPGRAWPVFVGWALTGIAEGAYGVAASTALYSVVPDSSARPAYFAFYNLLTFLFAAGGAAGATWLVMRMEHVSLTIGPWHLEQFQLLYLLAALMLVPCIFGTQWYPAKKK